MARSTRAIAALAVTLVSILILLSQSHAASASAPSSSSSSPSSKGGKAFLLVSIPLVGHMNPLLVTGYEMAERGWDVLIPTTYNMISHANNYLTDIHHLKQQQKQQQQQRREEGEETSPLARIFVIDIGSCCRDMVADTIAVSTSASVASPQDGSLILYQWAQSFHLCYYDAVLHAIAPQQYANYSCPSFEQNQGTHPQDFPSLAGTQHRIAAVVTDVMTLSGHDIANTIGVPVAVNNADLLTVLSPDVLPPFDFAPSIFVETSENQHGFIYRILYPIIRAISRPIVHMTVSVPLNQARATRGLQPLDLFTFLKGKLILVNSVFGLEYNRPLPPLIRLVGPLLPFTPTAEITTTSTTASKNNNNNNSSSKPGEVDQEIEWIDSATTPVVYVSMGTIAQLTSDQTIALFRAFQRVPFRILWKLKLSSISPAVQSILTAEQTPNIRIKQWVPSQLRVLSHPHTKAFLSHCGLNSAYESLMLGTPLLCLPIFADQPDMARRVVDAGVGLALSDRSSLTYTQVEEAISDLVLNGSRFEKNVRKLQQLVRFSGGVQVVGDLLEIVAEFGADHWMTAADKLEPAASFLSTPISLDVLGVYVIFIYLFIYSISRMCCGRSRRKHKKEE